MCKADKGTMSKTPMVSDTTSRKRLRSESMQGHRVFRDGMACSRVIDDWFVSYESIKRVYVLKGTIVHYLLEDRQPTRNPTSSPIKWIDIHKGVVQTEHRTYLLANMNKSQNLTSIPPNLFKSSTSASGIVGEDVTENVNSNTQEEGSDIDDDNARGVDPHH